MPWPARPSSRRLASGVPRSPLSIPFLAVVLVFIGRCGMASDVRADHAAPTAAAGQAPSPAAQAGDRGLAAPSPCGGCSAQPTPTPTETPTPWYTAANSRLEPIESFITCLSLVVGGFWIYFQFIKGRVLKPRLEPTVSGAVHPLAESALLIAQVSVKNVGNTRVQLDGDSSGLRILAWDETLVERWKRISTVDVFGDGEWFEPGESLSQTIAQELPEMPQVIRLELVLAATTRTSWKTSCVLVSTGADPKRKET